MDATRTRLSFDDDHLAERVHIVVVGAAMMLALVVALLLIREIRIAPQAFAKSAAVATGVPAEVVSVATLVLAPDRQIHVGDRKPDTVARLVSQTLVKQTEERGPFGLREVRSYTGFTLVFEPLARAGEQRVAAIYVE
ncbi:MAG TPA: hypothetical protein VKE51_29730 [Vicinamibacterales bacterium]|nr:hypothetical protein [Vicinamibacterales bacterium]